MSPSTFDPFELLPFTGYIEPSTGVPDQYLSLAHFVHTERVAGVDEHYRKYLLNLDDPELFRLEVDGVGITSGERDNWQESMSRLLYAGIFMQALSNREHYANLIANVERLVIASCSFSTEAAASMGRFISDVQAPEDQLKVAFLGDEPDTAYVDSCLSVIFAKRQPLCLLALEGDGCSKHISGYARGVPSAFSTVPTSIGVEAVADNLKRRCSHVFLFEGGEVSPFVAEVAQSLVSSGVAVNPIKSKA